VRTEVVSRARVAASFETDCVICGIAAYDADIVAVLGLAERTPELQLLSRSDGSVTR
jgi:hypothetical protein